MISRRSFIGGLLVTPAIVRASSLMRLPRRSDALECYRPCIPLIVTSVAAKTHKLSGQWTLLESTIAIIKPVPDSVIEELANQSIAEGI